MGEDTTLHLSNLSKDARMSLGSDSGIVFMGHTHGPVSKSKINMHNINIQGKLKTFKRRDLPFKSD